jgi:subtilisin family serine protease
MILCLAAGTQAKHLDDGVQYASNRFIVKLWPGTESFEPVFDGVSVQVSNTQLAALNAKREIVHIERLFNGTASMEAPETDLSGYWRFWLAEPVDLEAMLSEYAAASIVEHVEPVGIHPLYYTPNDPGWPFQWHIRNTGGDHDIDATEGWEVERGDTLAILGIVDTGVLYTHPDLRGNLWRNWSESNGVSGQDDDSNGFVDDSVGWDFVTGESDIMPGEDGDLEDNDPKDFNGHGTHCSGIAAAQTNNGIGVAGIAGGGSGEFGARILALRVGWTAPSGMGYVGMDFCAQAINYARQRGACAVNCSWGSSNSGGIGAAVNAAVAAGMIFCVAAGNDDSQTQSYLASRGDCIDIAATDNGDVKASFSNYGTWVDVSAPGVNIYATYSDRYVAQYAYLSGTSMAAPCVTGEVGLLKSHYPSWDREDITDAIIENVDNIYDENPTWQGQLGSGRINVNLALLSLAVITLLEPNGGEVWFVNEVDTIRWTSEGYFGNIQIMINRSYPSGPWETIVSSVPNSGQYAWTVTVPTTASARIRVIGAANPALGDTSAGNFTIALANIIVDYPNGGESWCAGQTETILWRGAGLGGTVTISLNRNFPSGLWETLFDHTTNDGSQAWEVMGAASSAARLRVVLDSNPSLRDSSNANFVIISPCIEVTSPVGGEFWEIGESYPITWESGEVTGNVEIAVNRNYPVGSWEILFPSSADDETEMWNVSGPAAATCRVRVKSIQAPAVWGISPANFWIIEPNEAPRIIHDPVHDSWESEVMITAVIQDDSLPQPPTIQLFYRVRGAPTYDRTIMEATGYPNEYASLLSLGDGSYEYYIRAVDMLGASDSTDNLFFDVGFSCEEELAFDDGEGEAFDWVLDTRFRWAVKLSPPAFPFVLCGARYGVARAEPDSFHQPVAVEIRLDNGGLPGLAIYGQNTGSVGNIVGGVPEGVPLWADVVLRDEEFSPIPVYGDFFLIVGNTDSSGYEAFARDTTSENQGRSFFFDPEQSVWHNENDAFPGAHPGNRLIRAYGYVYQPPESFALLTPTDGDTVWTLTPTLAWEDASTPNPSDEMHYVLYWSQDSNFVQGVDSVTTDSSFYSFAEGNRTLVPKPDEKKTLDDELPDDITIYWRVRAVNWLNLTVWCTPETGWDFAVFYRQAPNPFHLLSPADDAILTGLEVDLQWQAATDPDPGDSISHYRVYVAGDSLFSEAEVHDVSGTSFHLTELQYGYAYWWKILAFDTYGLEKFSSEIWSFYVALDVPIEPNAIPNEFALEQNYPNPFNPSTTIRIAVPRPSRVSIVVFDILGQKVATIAGREFDAGYHTLSWNCQSCAAGIYFLRMRAEEFVQTRKMLIVK